MKSFFKKIALVLVLAMVVTMLPAKVVSAADAEGPQLSKQVKVYIGGDKSGSYSESAYAKVWNKDGYTVQFSIDNEAVATVGKNKGLVTAVGVGEATVTAVFKDKNGKTITKTCPVVVKKNAVLAGISENSAKTLAEGLTVGETFQPMVFRTSADGETSWKGKDVITDGARFTSSNTDVFTVAKTTGKITAVAAGEATLTVWAVQGEKPAEVDANGKVVEYLPTTEKVEYPVKVVASDAVVTGVTVKSITEIELAVAGVTAENVGSLKIFNVNGGEVTSLFKDPTLSEDGKTVKLVKYFPLTNNEELTFAFGDGKGYTYTVKVGAAKAIIIDGPSTVVVGASPVDIAFRVVDENGLDLQIAFDPAKIKFETTEANYYSVVSNGKIAMYQVDGTVALRATYNTGTYDTATYNEITLTSEPYVVRCVRESDVTVSGMKFMVAGGYDSSKLSNGTLSMQMKDVYRLFAEIALSNNTTRNSSEHAGFTFETLTPSYLIVDASSGYLMPVATGVAKILVKYTDGGITSTAVATINVQANSEVSYLTVEGNGQVISSSASVDEKATIKIAGVDQYGETQPVTVTEVKSVGTLPNGVSASTAESYLNALVGTNQVDFSGASVAVAGTYTYRVTAAGKTIIVNVTVKDPGVTRSYKVLVDKSSLEVKPEDVSGIDDFKVTFKIVGVDSNNIASELVTALPADDCTVKAGNTSAYSVVNDAGVWTATFAQSQGIVSGSAEVTGSSIYVALEEGYEGFDVQTGTFVVSATVGGRLAVPANIAVSMKTNTPAYEIKNASISASAASYEAVILDQIEFTDRNRTFINKQMAKNDDYLSSIQPGSTGSSYVLVKTIKVYELVGNNYVCHKIAVNRYFSVTIQ